MTIADTLRESRRRIEEPEKWGKGEELNGLRLCPLLAMSEICDGTTLFQFNDCYRFFRNAIGNIGIPSWNDAPERTHADVLQAFDKAIELAERQDGTVIFGILKPSRRTKRNAVSTHSTA